MAVRVVIADDHGVVRAGLHALLSGQPGLEVCGEAASADDALRLVGETDPDILLLDISMPDRDGIQVAREVRERHPSARVLFLTVHEDQALLREALRAGAAGYVVKRAIESELLDAIAAVMRGDLYVHPSMMRALLAEKPVPTPGMGAAVGRSAEALTTREIEVLQLIAQGYTNTQIADRLVLSVRTVDTHRANIMGKLGLKRRAELVQYALAHGLFDEPL